MFKLFWWGRHGVLLGVPRGGFLWRSVSHETQLRSPFLLIGAGKRKGEDSENDIEGGGKALLRRRVDLFDEAHRRYQEARTAYENILRVTETTDAMQRAKRMNELRTEAMRAQAAIKRGEDGAEERLRKAQDAIKILQGDNRALRREAEQRLGVAQDALREAYRNLPTGEKQKHIADLPLYDLYEGSEKLQLVADLKDPYQVFCLLQMIPENIVDSNTNEVVGTRMVETGFLRCYNVDGLWLHLMMTPQKDHNSDPLSGQPFTADELGRVQRAAFERLKYIYGVMFQDAPQFEKYYPIYFRNYGRQLTKQSEYGEVSRFVDSLSDMVLVMVVQSYQGAFKYENLFSLHQRPESFWKTLVQWVEGSQKKIATASYREHVEQFRGAAVFLLTQPLQRIGLRDQDTTEYVYPTGKTREDVAAAFRSRLRPFKKITLDGTVPLLRDDALFTITLGDRRYVHNETYDHIEKYFMQIVLGMFKYTNTFDAGKVYHITISLSHYDPVQFHFGPLLLPPSQTGAAATELIPEDMDAFLHERLTYGTDVRYTEVWPAVLAKLGQRYKLLIRAAEYDMHVAVEAYDPSDMTLEDMIDDILSYDIMEDVAFVNFTFVLIPSDNHVATHQVIYHLSLPSWDFVSDEQKEQFFKHGNFEQFGLRNPELIFVNVEGTTQNPDGYVVFPELSKRKKHLTGIWGPIGSYADRYTESGVDTVTTISVELFYPTTTKVYFNNKEILLKDITYEWFVRRFSAPPQSGGTGTLTIGFDEEPKQSYHDDDDILKVYSDIIYTIRKKVKKNQPYLRISMEWRDD